MSDGATLRGVPNPRQEEFFKATARHIGYGGARGGGKSWAMRRKFVLLALNYPRLRLLLLRRTFPELEANHIRPLLEELNGIAKYSETKRMFKFANGSSIKMGYCDAEKDVYQYQGQEYDVVGFEEATQFTPSQIQFVLTCNRTTRADFSPRAYYTMNPGGVGHNYIKRLFIDRRFEEGEDPNDYVFVPAKVADNPALMQNDPGYVKILKALPEHLRRAYLDGDWDVVEGQFFQEFRRALHVCEPFEIPPFWRRFRAMDWGYNDPCCVLWFAVSPDKRVYAYRELYVRQTLASDIALRVKELTGGEKIAYTVASPDMWAKRGMSDVIGGESVSEVFIKSGVPVIPADNSRVVGWQRVRENLSTAPDGLPFVQLFPSCENLIRTFPVAPYDDHDHEDISDHCEDHALEAFRYGLMSRPSPAKTLTAARKNVLAYDPFFEPRKASGGFFGL